jgi:hypothetical protein
MCWHKWSKWKTIERGNMERTGISGNLANVPEAPVANQQRERIGIYEYQSRDCEKCGKVQLREASA